MKKYLAAAFVCMATIGSATAFEPLPLPADAHHPVLAPDGSTLLYSTVSHTGLRSLSLADGSTTVIDESTAAGFQPVFSTDSRTVFYRTAETVDGLTYRDVRSYTFGDGTSRRLAAPSRDKVDLQAMAGGDYALADYRTIKVVRDGMETNVSPLADSHSYLWASLNSEGRLLFMEPFSGVYVADADGSNPRRILSKGDFPSWAGKNRVVAVVSRDDGYLVMESRLVSVDLTNGETRDITPADVLVSEATASEDGTVVFSDINGKMFILNLDEL